MNTFSEVSSDTPFLDDMMNKIAALRTWRPQIETALHHAADTHTFDDICGMVLSGRLAMFVYPLCFLIMEKTTFPQYSVLHCFMAGGDMQAVLDTEADMAVLGKQMGCKYMSFAGRDGWMRVHKNSGWKTVCTTMYKPIT